MKTGLIALLFFVSAHVFAVDTHRLPTPELQTTYESIISELRCLVCQNQTIADSNAELAADLRRQVYEMLMNGKSKDDIHRFMTERYGDFVLYNPPFKAKTGVLWLAPAVFLLTGFVMIVWYVRRKQIKTEAVEDKALQEKARRLLESENEERS